MTRERYQFANMTISVVELERRTTVMLLNQDYALDVAEPLQPNVIQVLLITIMRCFFRTSFLRYS
jgi:hypothetical protein